MLHFLCETINRFWSLPRWLPRSQGHNKHWFHRRFTVTLNNSASEFLFSSTVLTVLINVVSLFLIWKSPKYSPHDHGSFTGVLRLWQCLYPLLCLIISSFKSGGHLQTYHCLHKQDKQQLHQTQKNVSNTHLYLQIFDISSACGSFLTLFVSLQLIGRLT